MPALHVSVDGSYTNRNTLRHLPENTALIGRIRKDAKLSAKPQLRAQRRGRRRYYGEDLPTPESIRPNRQIQWVKVWARAGGRWRESEVKTPGPLRWRIAGEMDLRLVVIRPEILDDFMQHAAGSSGLFEFAGGALRPDRYNDGNPWRSSPNR